MAKKSKPNQTEPNPASVASKDVHQRLNYLYQSSLFLSTALPTSSAPRKGNEKAKQLPAASKDFLIPTQTQPPPSPPELGLDETPIGIEEATAVLLAEGRSSAEHRGEDSTAPSSAASPHFSSEPRALPLQEEQPNKIRKKRGQPTLAVSRMLVKTMREVAKKATVRMDPSVKRTLCKGCCAVLIPGVTCKVRIKPSGPHAHLIVKTCFNCKLQLRLPAPPHLAEPPPEEEDPEEMIEVEAGGGREEDQKPMTKREKREARQARRPTFFEREGHVTFVGSERVNRTA